MKGDDPADTDRLGDGAVSVLVHVLEDLLERSLLPHELPEGQAAVKVTIHPLEEVLNFRPGGVGGDGGNGWTNEQTFYTTLDVLVVKV